MTGSITEYVNTVGMRPLRMSDYDKAVLAIQDGELSAFKELYPKDWQEHSFAALCGTSEHAMLWMLEQNPGIRSVYFCLDHDEAGIEASGRLADILREHGCGNVGILRSEYKDWNEDLKTQHGLPAQKAEEHPQMIAAPAVCRRIAFLMENARPDQLGRELDSALKGYRPCAGVALWEKPLPGPGAGAGV